MEMNFGRYQPALERQAQSWFWMNDLMRPWIISLDKLVEVKKSNILVNLHGFNELYTSRYYRGKLNEVCPDLIEKIIKPELKLFIQKIGYRAHSFTVNFRIGGESFEKTFTIINPDWE